MPEQVLRKSDATPAVLLLTLSYHPPEGVVAYANRLQSLGVQTHVVVADEASARVRTFDAGVRIHTLVKDEGRLLFRYLEQLLIVRGPAAVFKRARRFTRRSRVLRPIDLVLGGLQYAHQRIAGAFHGRIFTPIYRQVRPLLLARHARKSLKTIDLAGVDRIVAADTSAVPLGWRLARRYPAVPATTALEIEPYEQKTAV